MPLCAIRRARPIRRLPLGMLAPSHFFNEETRSGFKPGAFDGPDHILTRRSSLSSGDRSATFARLDLARSRYAAELAAHDFWMLRHGKEPFAPAFRTRGLQRPPARRYRLNSQFVSKFPAW